jgi:hypothetical protein
MNPLSNPTALPRHVAVPSKASSFLLRRQISRQGYRSVTSGTKSFRTDAPGHIIAICADLADTEWWLIP